MSALQTMFHMWHGLHARCNPENGASRDAVADKAECVHVCMLSDMHMAVCSKPSLKLSQHTSACSIQHTFHLLWQQYT